MSWTDERVELLKKMWSEGQSASQIAKELGSVTRNAVIGKVHRLGLSNRAGTPAAAPSAPEPKPAAPAAAAPKAAAPAAPKPAAPKPEAARPDPDTAEDETEDLFDAPEEEEEDEAPSNVTPLRRAIIPAGQPLPPQPSLNEISPEALAKVNEIEKIAKTLTLMELTERTCKWPVGDPATPDFWFCGLPVQAGKPYCEAHVGVAFQPMSARRDRKR